MTTEEHLAYWQWSKDLGGGYTEISILYLDQDRVKLVAHMDYHESQPPQSWTLPEVRRLGPTSPPSSIPANVWKEVFEKLP